MLLRARSDGVAPSNAAGPGQLNSSCMGQSQRPARAFAPFRASARTPDAPTPATAQKLLSASRRTWSSRFILRNAVFAHLHIGIA